MGVTATDGERVGRMYTRMCVILCRDEMRGRETDRGDERDSRKEEWKWK